MKTYNKIDRTLAYTLVFFLGMFSIYLMIWFLNCRIITNLEYANFKTLDYKIELIKAYQEYHTTTKRLILNDSTATKVEQRVDSLENLEDCCE